MKEENKNKYFKHFDKYSIKVIIFSLLAVILFYLTALGILETLSSSVIFVVLIASFWGMPLLDFLSKAKYLIGSILIIGMVLCLSLIVGIFLIDLMMVTSIILKIIILVISAAFGLLFGFLLAAAGIEFDGG